MSSSDARSGARTLSWPEVLRKLRTQPTVSVPEAGFALANLKKNAAYDAAKDGTLGVPVLDVGGLKRVPSLAVLRKLGLDDLTRTVAETPNAAESAAVA